MEALSIIILLVYLVICIFAANKFQEIAEMKGHKERYWAWCFWLPFFGIPMVIALPDLNLHHNMNDNTNKNNSVETKESKLENAANDLKGYKELLDIGAITEEEFEKVKNETMKNLQ